MPTLVDVEIEVDDSDDDAFVDVVNPYAKKRKEVNKKRKAELSWTGVALPKRKKQLLKSKTVRLKEKENPFFESKQPSMKQFSSERKVIKKEKNKVKLGKNIGPKWRSRVEVPTKGAMRSAVRENVGPNKRILRRIDMKENEKFKVRFKERTSDVVANVYKGDRLRRIGDREEFAMVRKKRKPPYESPGFFYELKRDEQEREERKNTKKYPFLVRNFQRERSNIPVIFHKRNPHWTKTKDWAMMLGRRAPKIPEGDVFDFGKKVAMSMKKHGDDLGITDRPFMRKRRPKYNPIVEKQIKEEPGVSNVDVTVIDSEDEIPEWDRKPKPLRQVNKYNPIYVVDSDDEDIVDVRGNDVVIAEDVKVKEEDRYPDPKLVREVNRENPINVVDSDDGDIVDVRGNDVVIAEDVVGDKALRTMEDLPTQPMFGAEWREFAKKGANKYPRKLTDAEMKEFHRYDANRDVAYRLPSKAEALEIARRRANARGDGVVENIFDDFKDDYEFQPNTWGRFLDGPDMEDQWDVWDRNREASERRQLGLPFTIPEERPLDENNIFEEQGSGLDEVFIRQTESKKRSDEDDDDSTVFAEPKEHDVEEMKRSEHRGIGAELIEKLDRNHELRVPKLKSRMNMEEVRRHADEFTDGNMAYAWSQLRARGVKMPFIGEEYEPVGFASYVMQRERVVKPAFVMTEEEMEQYGLDNNIVDETDLRMHLASKGFIVPSSRYDKNKLEARAEKEAQRSRDLEFAAHRARYPRIEPMVSTLTAEEEAELDRLYGDARRVDPEQWFDINEEIHDKRDELQRKYNERWHAEQLALSNEIFEDVFDKKAEDYRAGKSKEDLDDDQVNWAMANVDKLVRYNRRNYRSIFEKYITSIDEWPTEIKNMMNRGRSIGTIGDHARLVGFLMVNDVPKDIIKSYVSADNPEFAKINAGITERFYEEGIRKDLDRSINVFSKRFDAERKTWTRAYARDPGLMTFAEIEARADRGIPRVRGFRRGGHDTPERIRQNTANANAAGGHFERVADSERERILLDFNKKGVFTKAQKARMTTNKEEAALRRSLPRYGPVDVYTTEQRERVEKNKREARERRQQPENRARIQQREATRVGNGAPNALLNVVDNTR